MACFDTLAVECIHSYTDDQNVRNECLCSTLNKFLFLLKVKFVSLFLSFELL